MKMVIRFTAREETRALPLLLRHSPGMVLPERTYVVSEEAVNLLRQRGIRFAELGTELDAPTLEGAALGERV